MTLTQLEYVVAVATYKSFVAAAEKCFVTQPTLSMQIQKLEDELEIKIFDRNKQPIRITAIGEMVVAQAKKALEESNRVYELIQQQNNILKGEFQLAVIPTIAPYIIPNLLRTYSEQYPDVRLDITEMETKAIVKALKNDEIDAALLSTPLEDNAIKEYPLFQETFTVYLPEGHELLEHRLVDPENIDFQHLWLMNEGHCMRNQILNLCSEYIRQFQKERNYTYESSNVETLKRMVDRVGGMTIIPELALMDFSENEMERIRYFISPEPAREISLVTNDHFVRTSILQSVMDSILELVPEKVRVQRKERKILRIQSARLA